MTTILFVALLRYILNQIVKSECQRPHGVSGHEEVISNATNSIPTNTCFPNEHLPALAPHRSYTHIVNGAHREHSLARANANALAESQ
jgi:hypothetical protein